MSPNPLNGYQKEPICGSFMGETARRANRVLMVAMPLDLA
jgi:hypothetical protein